MGGGEKACGTRRHTAPKPCNIHPFLLRAKLTGKLARSRSAARQVGSPALLCMRFRPALFDEHDDPLPVGHRRLVVRRPKTRGFPSFSTWPAGWERKCSVAVITDSRARSLAYLPANAGGGFASWQMHVTAKETLHAAETLPECNAAQSWIPIYPYAICVHCVCGPHMPALR